MDILRHEVLAEQLERRGGGGGGALLRPMFTRTMADVQERLIYRWGGLGGDDIGLRWTGWCVCGGGTGVAWLRRWCAPHPKCEECFFINPNIVGQFNIGTGKLGQS